MTDFLHQRTGEDALSTAGTLSDLQGRSLAATLERSAADREHPRIPAGVYPLSLRKLGTSRFDEHYSKRFGPDYRGIVQIGQVPGRSFIEIHMGNWYFDTLGCLILGASVRKNPTKNWFEIPPGESAAGFWIAYQSMRDAILAGGAEIDVRDTAAPLIS